MRTFFGMIGGKTFENSDNIESKRMTCGWCNCVVSPNIGYKVLNDYGQEIGEICVCPNCSEIILSDYLGNVYPQANYGKNLDKLPNDISILYDECRSLFSIGAYTSVVLLARKLLMHVAVDYGDIEGKSFVEYIKYLEDNHFIPPNAKKLLETIRGYGNEANHKIVIKDEIEAKQIIDFLTMILTFMYEFSDE